MGKKFRLVIPRKPPPTGNRLSRLHWTKKREIKKLWQDEVAIAAILAGKPRLQRAKVQIVLYYRVIRRRDSDNLMGGAGKFLLDGLRYAGVIPDDDQLTIEVCEPKVVIDRERPRVEIELTELEGGVEFDGE